MADTKADVCRLPEFGIDERYDKIPYDVDFQWNDGCGGKDIWTDEAGTSVSMLVSSSGSAYVCPEGRDGFWRIYVDSYGQAYELGRWPRPSSRDYDISDASKEFGEVLACAGIEHLPARQCRMTALHGMRSGLEVALPAGFGIDGVYDWSVAFDEDEMVLKNEHNWDRFYVDAVPIVSNTYEPDVEHDHGVIEYYEPTDRETLIDIAWQMGRYAERTAGLEHGALDLAAGIFERACRTTLEIDAFEAACYGDELPALARPAKVTSAEAPVLPQRKAIVIGDSIVASYDYLYPKLIGVSLRPEAFEVSASGRNGDTIVRALGVEDVDGAREVHLGSVLKGGYDDMILALGVNSVAAGWKAEFLIDYVRDACEMAMDSGVTRIVLVEIAPWKGWRKWTERKQAETSIYNEMIAHLADELNFDYAERGCETVVEVAKVYDALEDEARPDHLKYPRTVHGELDRLHPDERGLRVIAEQIVDQIYDDFTTEEYRQEKERLMFRSQ